MSFRRLTAGHVIAFVAAICLLFALAPDWYTDKVGENFRFYQHDITPQLNQNSLPHQVPLEAAAAAGHEKNAWQASAAIDRIILIVLLATAALAIVAAFLRAYDRDIGPPSPIALASVTGLVGCALIAYRIIQPPGFNEIAVVKWGAPLGLLCVGVLTVGARMAVREQRDPAARSRARARRSAPAAPESPEQPDAPASPAGVS